MHNNDPVPILGIPIDNLTMKETVECIHALVLAYRKDGKPRLVATVNVDFLVNTLRWFSAEPRHPELLSILQHADLVTADGMPLIWASRFLGTPLKERVTGADLVPRLATSAAEKKHALYFLGGKGEVGKKTAETLAGQNPGLIIAGVDAPFVHTQGEALEHSEKEDNAIIQRINKTNPDILLVAFGNPKQEAWFQRNRCHLKAGVTIGIGGTFEFITGGVSRAPLWMQQRGFEWIYRLLQDPKRLWKRYLIGLFKFTVMIFPIILHARWQRFRMPDPRTRAPLPTNLEKKCHISNKLNIIPIPEVLDAAVVMDLKQREEEWLSHDSGLILDFTHVRFIDSSGLGFVLGLWKRGSTRHTGFHMVGVQPAVLKTLKLNRVESLLSDHMSPTLDDVVSDLNTPWINHPFFYTIKVEKGVSILQLCGTLDAMQMQNIDVSKLLREISAVNVIIDLSQLTFVDSTGLILLLKIKKATVSTGHRCVTCGAGTSVAQMLRITRLATLFPSMPDSQSALKELTQ